MTNSRLSFPDFLPSALLPLLLISSLAVADISEHRPVCSNDGSKMAYMLKSEQTDDDWELYLIQLDSQVRSRLTNHPGWDGYPVWSPDDKRIIFDREDAPGLPKRPWIMDLVKRTTKPLGSFDGWVSVSSWSSDNQLLGFQELDKKRDLILLDLSGKIVKKLTNTEEFNESDAVFSPEGSQIAYAGAKLDGSETSLDLLDVESGQITKLHTSIGRIYGVTWSTDGNRIAFDDAPEGDDDDADVFIYNVEEKSVRQVTTDPAWDHMPEFCKNRPTIFFTSYRSGEERIYQIDPEPTPLFKIESAEK